MGKKIWNILESILKLVFIKILRLSFIEKNWDGFMQFVKFGLVGVSNTLISYVVYLVGVFVGMHYLVASILGFIISVVNAFFWNNRYVFKTEEGEQRNILESFCKTVLSYAGTGLVLNNILLVIQIDFLSWPETMAPLVNLLITIPLNFLLNKLWAFRKR